MTQARQLVTTRQQAKALSRASSKLLRHYTTSRANLRRVRWDKREKIAAMAEYDHAIAVLTVARHVFNGYQFVIE